MEMGLRARKVLAPKELGEQVNVSNGILLIVFSGKDLVRELIVLAFVSFTTSIHPKAESGKKFFIRATIQETETIVGTHQAILIIPKNTRQTVDFRSKP